MDILILNIWITMMKNYVIVVYVIFVGILYCLHIDRLYTKKHVNDVILLFMG